MNMNKGGWEGVVQMSGLRFNVDMAAKICGPF